MKRFTTIAMAVAAIVTSLGCYAGEYKTAGDKSNYTLEKLSTIDGSGVTCADGEYIISDSLTIAATDTFTLKGGEKVKLNNGVYILIKGHGNMAPAEGVTFTRSSKLAMPKGIGFDSGSSGELANVGFQYCGLRYAGDVDFSIKNCSFTNVGTSLSTVGAIQLLCRDCTVTVENCTFDKCDAPAIGGAANYYSGLVFNNNSMNDCNVLNTNKPFVNITIGGNLPIVITNNTIVGNKRNMVGGIGVSNMTNADGTNNVTISGNEVRDCRYGITTYGPMNAVINDNVLINNCYEQNANNGGSGVSLYDPYQKQTAKLAGNQIEGSLWGVTVIYCGNINLGRIDVDESDADYCRGENVFKNNGNGGVKYDLYNNSPRTVYAQNNTWGVDTQDQQSIEGVITHKNDNSSLGEVIFMPAKDPSAVAEITANSGVYYNRGTQCLMLQQPDGVQVFTVGGVLVKSAYSATMVDLSGLDGGVYVVKTSGETVKIVK